MTRPADRIDVFVTHDSGSTGSDSENLNCNGSGTPGVYEWTPTKWAFLSRVLISIVDGTIRPTYIGGVDPSAHTGMKIEIINADGSTVDLDFMPSHPVKKNADFALLGGSDVEVIAGAGDDHVVARWSLFRAHLEQDTLDLAPGEAFRVTIQDDYSGLTEFRIKLQGEYSDSGKK